MLQTQFKEDSVIVKSRSWVGSSIITVIASSGCWSLLRFRDNFPLEGVYYWWLTVAAIIAVATGVGLIALWAYSSESNQQS